MSPRCAVPRVERSARITSPARSAGAIDAEGTRKGWTTQCLTAMATRSASTTQTAAATTGWGRRRRAVLSRVIRGLGSARSGVLALLPDAGLLAREVAQVVQLRAAHVATGDDLDLVDRRRVHREHALHADAEGDLPDAEGLSHAVALTADDVPLEDLDAGAVALDDLHVHLDVVAGAEGGDVLAQRCLVELVELLHVLSPALRLRSDGVVRGTPRGGAPSKNRRSGVGSPPCRCAGPLAATPIATDLPDRFERPPLRQRVARCAQGVILPAPTRQRQAAAGTTVPVITARGCRMRHGLRLAPEPRAAARAPRPAPPAAPV